MKWVISLVCLGLMTGCVGSNTAAPVSVSSLAKVVDEDLRNATLCAGEDFSLTPPDIARYFTLAEEITASESHYRSLILPCRYEGELTKSGIEYSYEVIAGGTGYLYPSDGGDRLNFICEEKACCDQFTTLC